MTNDKIVITIDFHKAVVDALAKILADKIVINNTTSAKATTTIVDAVVEAMEAVEDTHEETDDSSIPYEYEYAPSVFSAQGKRRNKLDMRMHEEELKLSRRLSVEEKAAITTEYEAAQEELAKAVKKAEKDKRIADLTAGISTADKREADSLFGTSELPEEAKTDTLDALMADLEDVPVTDSLTAVDTLFS